MRLAKQAELLKDLWRSDTLLQTGYGVAGSKADRSGNPRPGVHNILSATKVGEPLLDPPREGLPRDKAINQNPNGASYR